MSIDTSTIDSTLYNQLSTESKFATSSSSGGYGDLTSEDFLSLITAQLENQDPTQPMENAELMAQITQLANMNSMDELTTSVQDGFSDLGSGVDDIYALLSGTSGNLTRSGAADAANYLGRSVQAWSDQGVLPEGGTLMGGAYASDESATQIEIQISDADGETLASYTLTPDASGLVTFSWDGTCDDGTTAPAGSYTLAATAYTSAGEELEAATYVDAYVDAVYPNALDEPRLSLKGLGDVALSDVLKLY